MKLDHSKLPSKPNPNWRKDCILFMRIVPLTKEDLLAGRNGVEKIAYKEIFSSKTPIQAAPAPKQSSSAPAKVMKFGKYKGQTTEWIKQNDPRYYEWALENIRGFAKM